VTCSVTLSQAVLVATTVSLSSNALLLSVPASLIVPAGSAVGSATATAGVILTDLAVTVSATLGASSQTTTVDLWPPPVLTSLSCSPGTVSVGSSTVCTVAIAHPHVAGTVGISSGNPALVAPSSLSVLMGQTMATFTASATAGAGNVVLTASYYAITVSATVTIQASAPTSALRSSPGSPNRTGHPRLTSISCKRAVVHAATNGVCQMELENPSDSFASELHLKSSNDAVRLPATVAIMPGQPTARFQIEAASASGAAAATITAQLGEDIVQDTLTLDREPLRLEAPGHQYAKFGGVVQFQVVSLGPVASLAASGLPAGATFDAASGLFQWHSSNSIHRHQSRGRRGYRKIHP